MILLELRNEQIGTSVPSLGQTGWGGRRKSKKGGKGEPGSIETAARTVDFCVILTSSGVCWEKHEED